MRRTWGWAWLTVFLCLGCGDDGGSPGDRDSGPGEDGGGDGGGECCTADSECDDGLYCNGSETCSECACVAGSAPDCDDGVDCTTDRCVEADRACTNAAPDDDGDGFEDAACTDAGGTPLGDDCDDGDADVHPGATEVCDLDDEDCNGSTFGTLDRDGDGHISAACCNDGACGADCDDSRRGTSPDASEICEGYDNDCDGLIDETVSVPTFSDEDRDLHGDPERPTMSCPGAVSASPVDDDCDDGNRAAHGAQVEICDGFDNDCDMLVDEETRAITWYRDGDGDGFGSAGSGTTVACDPPAGYSILPSDCDDDDPTISPLATEACNGRDDNCNGRADFPVGPGDFEDDDGDGVVDRACGMGAADCDDRDPAARPGATELCDLRDNDCNGIIDDGTGMAMWYLDADGDGWGADADPVNSCTPVEGRIPRGGDCDDAAAMVHPGEVDACNGVNDDCDSSIDEDASRRAFYPDTDGDGFGSSATSTLACVAPAGHVDAPADCNDMDALASPEGAERCNFRDDDCDGAVDEGVLAPRTVYRDADGDGYGVTSMTMTTCMTITGYVDMPGDCDDTTASRNPGRTEVCNGLDDDCDLVPDDGAGSIFYRDADADLFGDASMTRTACTAPLGYVSMAGDCDDTMSGVNPASPETCNSRDDDCDGMADEGVGMTYYRDLDMDGFGNPSMTRVACAMPAGYVSSAGDCDDAAPETYTGAPELCDLQDNDCDGSTDEGAMRTFYRDADGDGFGNPAITVLGCAATSGYVGDATDCNDASSSIRPGAAEVCDGVDQDCDAVVDDGVQTTYYRDLDGDGYGNLAATRLACTVPSGYVANSTDCDDSLSSINPAAAEICNGRDDDCDGMSDEVGGVTFYRDLDGDTWGDAASTRMACTAPGGYVGRSGDCDDNAGSVYPGAPEICDLLDNDCDSMSDEGVQTTFYRDADGDTYGNAAVTTLACVMPAGYVTNNTDCDDGAAAVRPGAAETCNGIDDNCNSVIDEGVRLTYYRDLDMDTYGNAMSSTLACSPPVGYVTNSTDCNDAAMAVNPGATEVCNGIDDDCDVMTDEGVLLTFYRDMDGDLYGVTSMTMLACTAPGGYVAMGGDCDDTTNLRNPGRSEACNGIDDDCDTMIDDGASSTCSDGRVCQFAMCDGVEEVDGGQYFTCARLTSGRVKCWGSNNQAQLGDGTTTMRLSPVLVTIPGPPVGPLTDAVSLSVGEMHACVVRSGGTVACWGYNTNGETGTGVIGGNRSRATTVVDSSFVPLSGVTRVGTGANHSCAVRGDGTVACWGNNSNDQLGVETSGVDQPYAVNVAGIMDAVQVEGGNLYTCARRTGGTMMCWGDDTDGKLGNGPTSSSGPTPVTVVDMAGATVTGIIDFGATNNSACLARSGMRMMCWGFGYGGTRGDGSVGSSAMTYANLVGSGAIGLQMYAGMSDIAAIDASGQVILWGLDDVGQMADGMAGSAGGSIGDGIPDPGLLDPSTLMTGATGGGGGLNHLCAQFGAGVVRCWGGNTSGQCGDGTTTSPRLYPVRVLNVP